MLFRSITLHATYENGRVVVDIADDGAGLDLKKVDSALDWVKTSIKNNKA